MTLRTLVLLLLASAPGPLLAQTPPPLPEAQTCASIVVAFADGFARVPRKNTQSIEPVLVVANLLDTADTATITVHPAAGADIQRVVPLEGKRRATVDLYALVGRVDTDFFVEVEFGAFGHAELKMWSGGHATPAQGVTLCRTRP